MERKCRFCESWTEAGSDSSQRRRCGNSEVGCLTVGDSCADGRMTVDRGSGRVHVGPEFGCTYWRPCPETIQEMADEARRAPFPAMSKDELAALLKRWGLSQTQLGAMIGLSKQNVHNWLKGYRDIPPTAVVAMRALGLCADDDS